MTEPVGADDAGRGGAARGRRPGGAGQAVTTPRYPMLRRTKERTVWSFEPTASRLRTHFALCSHSLLPFPEEFYNCFVFNSTVEHARARASVSNHHRQFRVLTIGSFTKTRKADRTAALLRALVSTPVKRSHGMGARSQRIAIAPDVGLELAPPTASYVSRSTTTTLRPNRSRIEAAFASGDEEFRPKTASITWLERSASRSRRERRRMRAGRVDLCAWVSGKRSDSHLRGVPHMHQNRHSHAHRHHPCLGRPADPRRPAVLVR